MRYHLLIAFRFGAIGECGPIGLATWVMASILIRRAIGSITIVFVGRLSLQLTYCRVQCTSRPLWLELSLTTAFNGSLVAIVILMYDLNKLLIMENFRLLVTGVNIMVGPVQ